MGAGMLGGGARAMTCSRKGGRRDDDAEKGARRPAVAVGSRGDVAGPWYRSAPEGAGSVTGRVPDRPVIDAAATDRSHVGTTTEEVAALACASCDDVHRDIVERDGTDDALREHTTTVPMRFNRLVLLRPWVRHAAMP